MKSMFTSLFIMFISFNSYTSMFSQDLRMSVSGLYNGIRNETWDDNEDMESKYTVYTLDITCLEPKHLIFKGNEKNVTLKIYCGSSGDLIHKTRMNVKGKYKFSMSSIPTKNIRNCNSDDSVIYSISVEDSKGQSVYRCNLTVGECEG